MMRVEKKFRAAMPPYAVLFVCTGNICRSPTAHAVFRARVRAAGMEEAFHIDSAGTHDYHSGEPPDPRSVKTARASGIDMSDLRARQIRASDFDDFDLILAMDGGHLSLIQKLAPQGSRARIRLFADSDVPDPYYGGAQDFAEVLRMAEEGSDTLLSGLRKELSP
jgi:protein-tyrosine phosphatase